MNTIDFRSDTVTWPTVAMRQAMAHANVGDDVYGEDPTVNALEARAAALVGKEAGLFVASGTMGNLTAILTHATRGEEAILGADAHTYLWEAGGMATLGGVVPHPLPTDRAGRMSLDEIRGSIRSDDPHLPRTRLILLENSYGARSGYPVPLSYFEDVAEIARQHGLAVHVDGARFFNAAVALKIEPAELAAPADSVSFCLSKGLCAPVGSVLCGSEAFIHEARRTRKVLGGGMRQAGILAAAGLVALDKVLPRLAEDHANARMLARGLAEVPGIRVDLEQIKTNIVYFYVEDDVPLTAPEIAGALRQEYGVLIGPRGNRSFRAVTHYWVGPEEIRRLVDGVHAILAAATARA